MTTNEQEQQLDQSVQDTQLPPPSPPQATISPAETVTIVDVPDTSAQNINPLTAEDLKKILDQSTKQALLSADPVLVSMDELQKLVESTVKDKVNPQEPPSNIFTATSGQPQMPTTVTLGIVDTTT